MILSLGPHNVPLEWQTGSFPSGDACCVRDGIDAHWLASLVRDDCSAAPYLYDDSCARLRLTEIGFGGSHLATRKMSITTFPLICHHAEQ